MIEGIVPREIREGPAAIRATVDATREPARGRSRRACATAGVRRIYVIGNGTSYHSSLAAAALYRRHAGPDDPVVDPGHRRRVPDLPARARPARRDRRHLVVRRVQRRRRASPRSSAARIPTVGIVHVPGSSLTRVATGRRALGGRPERRAGDDQDLLGDARRRPSCCCSRCSGADARATATSTAILRGRRPRRGGDRRRRAARRAARRDASPTRATCSWSAAASPTRRRSRPRSSSRRWPSSTPRAPRPGR